MILSGREILKEMSNHNIVIDPFDINQLNPNSYNLRLDNVLKVYCSDRLDMRRMNKSYSLIIPEDGLTLVPGMLYLGKTVEYTETHKFVPCLEGRSSVGRLGIQIHITAGFGDIGFKGNWTLEISCIEPVRIYPNVEICQIYYQEVRGIEDGIDEYDGKYQNSTEILESRMYRDFTK